MGVWVCVCVCVYTGVQGFYNVSTDVQLQKLIGPAAVEAATAKFIAKYEAQGKNPPRVKPIQCMGFKQVDYFLNRLFHKIGMCIFFLLSCALF